MRQLLFIFCLACLSYSPWAQVADLVQADPINAGLHQANLGRIAFMNGNIPLDRFRQEDILSSFRLTPTAALNIRVFMGNSVLNYLHQLAPDYSAEKLLLNGNLQFSFYVDGKLIYQENIHHGCNFGSGGNKNTSTVFRVPFTSATGEDWWAMYMWDRFKQNGGQQALTNGIHELKVEIRPYLKIEESGITKLGALIAAGELKLIIEPIKVTRQQAAIQPIRPGSNWGISNLAFDKKKIEALNTEIASYSLKNITSIVVIREGKLMLEEYFNGASRETLHDTRSAGKSFTSTLMGIAIRDGYIQDENQLISSYYDLKDFSNYSPKKDSIKIKDLLTMSSSFDGNDADGDSPGNEENMYPTDDWVRFTLNLPLNPAKENGKRWDYFTAGVVLLGDILNKSVPGGLEQFADEKLFKPLHISNYKWQYTPQKVVNTAGSLQMRSLDYARYAQLYKQNGKWNGQQIIPATWVQKTLTQQIQIPGRSNQFYGYLFWNKSVSFKGSNYETFYCAGNGGNQFIIFKDLQLVIIITSQAYNKPYGHAQADRIVSDFILPAILAPRGN